MERLAPARARVPGGHAVGQPGRDGRRARHAAGRRRRRLRRAGRQRRPARRHARRGAWPKPVCRTGFSARATCFSVFFTEDAGAPTSRRAQATETWRFPAFFHALLDAGVYPPPQRVRDVVRLGRARRRRVRRASPRPPVARARPPRRKHTAGMTETTIVHVMRHGEVHNPDKILYGRLPGLPPVRDRAGTRPRSWRRRSPTSTSSRSSPRRWNARRRPRRPRPRRTACRCTSTTS